MNIMDMLTPVVPTGARSGRILTATIGVTIHNTGNYNRGASAVNHAQYLQGTGKKLQASWHYVVDDKDTIRCIPESEVAWHAGDGHGDGNYKTISIEICVNPDSDIIKSTDNAVQLAADILKRHGLTEANLYQHNHWSGKNCPAEIRKGNPYSWDVFVAKVREVLNPVVTPPAAPSNTYTVVPGDTLSEIAQRFGTTVSELARINGIAKPDLIYAGQVLKLSGPAAEPAPDVPTEPNYILYTVKQGENLWKISQKFLGSGIHWKKIYDFNGLTSDIIHAGQQLKIPK